MANLAERFPVNTLWELTLVDGSGGNDEVVEGRIYTTDELSQSVVVTKPLVHTTLSVDVRIIHAPYIKEAKQIENNGNAVNDLATTPLPKINKKQLEEREKKAIRLAQEGFRHINQKVRIRIHLERFSGPTH
jgi:hypothetical protein